MESPAAGVVRVETTVAAKDATIAPARIVFITMSFDVGKLHNPQPTRSRPTAPLRRPRYAAPWRDAASPFGEADARVCFLLPVELRLRRSRIAVAVDFD